MTAGTVNKLQELVSRLEKARSKFDLTIKADTTKVMASGGLSDLVKSVTPRLNKSTVFYI